MRNASTELAYELDGKANVKCADITYSRNHSHKITLPVDYTGQEYIDFMDKLDFEYDNGYGGQELFGTVWLEDDTWLERWEYDGSEGWEHKKLPQIPAELIKS